MFNLETVNELSCRCTSDGQRGKVFTKAGAMIGYRGDAHFEKVLLGPQGNPVNALMHQVGRRLTGENMPLMAVESRGQSEVYLANLSEHVTVIDLQPGMSLKVESENLLAFTESCSYGFKFLAQGVISQKGLFTSELKANGHRPQVAILTDGNPLVLQTPCCVDPDAIVAWTGPDPGFKLDLSWKNLLGQASGESYMFEFKQPGYQIIIQPSERKSGLKIAVDDGQAPDTQMSQSQNIAGSMGSIGDVAGTIGKLFGGR